MTRRTAILVCLVSMLLHPRVSAADDRGFAYLINKLIADGVDPDVARDAFDDPRMGEFNGLEFSPNQPRESHARYRYFTRPSTVAMARGCRTRYADAFEAAERNTQVPASVVAAILFVETGCGRNTGSSVVLYRLARLAMANEPENLRRNLWRFADSDGSIDPDISAGVRKRARYLEDTFYPEVRATFIVADRLGISPLAIRGSASGAFGYPQFLPTSYLKHGADGNGDGHVSLYNSDDAAASAARYLERHGWRPGLSREERRKVIWYYNHSDAYVDTVLTLAARLDGTAPPPQAIVKKTKAKQRKAKPKAVASSKRAKPQPVQQAKRTQRGR